MPWCDAGPRGKCPIFGTNPRATTAPRRDARHNHEVYARLLRGCKLIMDSSLLKFIGVRPRTTGHQPSNQPTNLVTNQPTNQPTDQPTDRPTDQPTDQPTNQPTNQPTRLIGRQPTNQPTI
uniref:Uncharacterized protein n=1 Tax=Branchiostoma floridae TaxID=7739 RepID=C3Y1D7_BRAFL|eukprot:XP_002609667.1 hypothetical protein BRAFLDRAFT_83671 [Branchiostoma floridae]